MLKLLQIFMLISCAIGRLQTETVESNKLEAFRNAKAEEVRKYMNESFDPCENFFEFACGNWRTHHPANTGAARTGALRMDQYAISDEQRQLLESVDEMDSESERKAKDFYHSCMQFSKDPPNLKDTMRKIANEFGDMPVLVGTKWQEYEFDWFAIVAEISHKYNMDIFLRFFIATRNDRDHNSFDMGVIGQPFLRKYDIEKRRKEYKQFLMDYLGLDQNVAEQTANEICDFESSISNAFETAYLKGDVNITIHELLVKYSAQLDLGKLLTKTYGRIPKGVITDLTPGYIDSLLEIIRQTPKRVVANYISFRLIYLVYTLEVKSDLESTYKCLLITEFSFAKVISHMFYRTFKLQAKEQYLIKMWQDIKSHLQMKLESSQLSWFDDKTREFALEKLHSLKMDVASFNGIDLDSEYRHLHINRSDYIGNIMALKTHSAKDTLAWLNEQRDLDISWQLNTLAYDVHANKILIGISTLFSEFLSSILQPKAVNYARLGFLLSHEMFHGFSGRGRRYNRLGDYRGKWEKAVETAYAERQKCLYEQYHNFTFGGKPLPQDEQQTENAADNVGVLLAYQAYWKWSEDSARTKEELQMETLPNLNYTNKQLFFISYSQMWCADTFEMFRSRYAAFDSHAPDEFRAFVPLINVDEFSKEFKCVKGSPMNPLKKCRIY